MVKTAVLHVDPLQPDLSLIGLAANLIQREEVVAFPTETVYGLGADATSDAAVRKIFLAKNRPQDNPLIVHVDSLEAAEKLVTFIPEIGYKLASTFWPGPLTLVLPRSSGLSDLVSRGLPSVAIRVPAHSVALSLIRQSGVPIAAPSANTSGKPSPTTASHVLDDFQDIIPMVLDGGSTLVGVESTVVSLLDDVPKLLRPGGVTREELEKIAPGLEVGESYSGNAPLSPGMKYPHYSPRTSLVLVEGGAMRAVASIDELAEDADVLILCTNNAHNHTVPSRLLGRTSKEIQANLFSSLRLLDDLDVSLGVVEGIPEVNEGFAIMNRLRKAAHEIIPLP